MVMTTRGVLSHARCCVKNFRMLPYSDEVYLRHPIIPNVVKDLINIKTNNKPNRLDLKMMWLHLIKEGLTDLKVLIATH
jgi:hypothetical protein